VVGLGVGIKYDLVRRAIRLSQEQSRFRGRDRERPDTQPMCCPRLFELAKEYGPDSVGCVLLWVIYDIYDL
jgi:hypothetical protein